MSTENRLFPARLTLPVTQLACLVLGFEQQAGRARASCYYARGQFFGFEFHGAASMREMLVPRDVIVLALVAVDIIRRVGISTTY